MQGRAGRRGMDVQGNVIYLGMDWPYIENLMLGQISKVTGKEPRYPLIALQEALAASNDLYNTNQFVHEGNFAVAIQKRRCEVTVDEDMAEWMCNTTLEEFCEGKESDHYMELSRKAITQLGYVKPDMRLNMDHNVLSMVWEMHNYMPEAIHLCACLEQLYRRFCYMKTKSFKESDATQNDFLAVLIHVIDRVPANEGEESLQQMLRLTPSEDGRALNDEAKHVWLETEEILMNQKKVIDELDIPDSEKQKCHLVLPPATGKDDVGPPLDKGVYEMIVFKKKGFSEDQSNERRNSLKSRIVKLGQICMLVHNNIQQPHGEYDALEVHFRRMFNNIKYSVADMMNQLMDQDDLTEV